jgi:hypothetical protein
MTNGTAIVTHMQGEVGSQEFVWERLSPARSAGSCFTGEIKTSTAYRRNTLAESSTRILVFRRAPVPRL